MVTAGSAVDSPAFHKVLQMEAQKGQWRGPGCMPHNLPDGVESF